MSHITELQRRNSNKVHYDPTNLQHLSALSMLLKDGKQHPTLRFVLEHPFVDIKMMMLTKTALATLSEKQI